MSQESFTEVRLSKRWLDDELKAINSLIQSEPSHDLVVSLLLSHKFNAIASKLRTDRERRLKDHFANALQSNRRPSPSGSWVTESPTIYQTPQSMPTDFKEKEAALEASVAKSPITYQSPTVSTQQMPVEFEEREAAWGISNTGENTPGAASEAMITSSSPSSPYTIARSNYISSLSKYIHSTSNQAHSESNKQHTSPPPMTDDNRRIIDFDDLYQNGEAAEKHWIIQHPVTCKWYILYCEHMHFGSKPMVGALHHLRTGQHGPSATRLDAFREMGIQIKNCDTVKARQNNDAFRKALIDGYKPFTTRSCKPNRRIFAACVPNQLKVGTSNLGSPRGYDQAQPSA